MGSANFFDTLRRRWLSWKAVLGTCIGFFRRKMAKPRREVQSAASPASDFNQNIEKYTKNDNSGAIITLVYEHNKQSPAGTTFPRDKVLASAKKALMDMDPNFSVRQ